MSSLAGSRLQRKPRTESARIQPTVGSVHRTGEQTKIASDNGLFTNSTNFTNFLDGNLLQMVQIDDIAKEDVPKIRRLFRFLTGVTAEV